MESSQPRNDRFLKLQEVLDLIKVSKSTLYAMVNQGRFPKPVRVGCRGSRWRESEVLQWMATRQRASRCDWT